MIPLAIIGAGVAIAEAASLVALHAGRTVVPRRGRWEAVPRVWLDPGLRLGPELVQAEAVWRGLGHQFGPLVLTDPGERAPDWIRIVPATPEAVARRTLAVAAVGISDDDGALEGLDPDEDLHDVPVVDGVIRYATIYLDPARFAEVDPTLIIAHELGHALGYYHCTARLRRAHPERGVQVPKHGHLMNPRADDAGWLTTGLAADPEHERAENRHHAGRRQ